MRNNLWKWVFVALVVVWSLYEIYPPRGRDLVQVFRERAVNKDVTFSNIVYQVIEAQRARPDRAYGNLQDAIGTNDIRGYFPFFNVQEEPRPTSAILSRLQREAAGRVKLGLDLRGGTAFTVEMDTSKLEDTGASGALDNAIEVLRKRVDKFGVAEPIIQPAGENRILIQLPGLSEADKEGAQRQIQRAAFLEFRLVHERSEELLREGLIEPGYEILKEERRGREGGKTTHAYLVNKKPERGMTGAYVKQAQVVRGNLGEPKIAFTLTSEGTTLFGDITRENVGRQLAIILDGELYSAPVIRTAIETGSGEISGSFDTREAFELANVLENPLRAPLRIIESRDVDPSLGADAIRSGFQAALIGTTLVCGFMLVYYLFAGLVANVALMLNIIILFGVMCSIGTTLTMPGIAGMVLTLGMAVDANVLIFERIREEAATGKSVRGALASGYDKAFSTIFDSNLTTLVSSVILIFMGTGPVKGFGVVLTIGVSANMFTALVVTRIIFDLLVERGWLKRFHMLQLVRKTRIDFLRWAVPAFTASWLLILVGNGYGLFVRGQDVLGVEFTGGASITLAFDQQQKPSVDRLREVASEASGSDVLVGYQRDVTAGTDTLRVTVRQPAAKAGGAEVDIGNQVVGALKEAFPESQFSVLGADKVGPTVGRELQRVAVLAALLAMFGMLVYVAFRYEFSFAVGAVIALVHDVLMTLGLYFLVGRQMNATTVAALLTIIGFSINDTIVIFDRVREDLKLGIRGTFREILNQALNQCLSRTIITSATVFLAGMALYLFGGGVINDFAFAFLVGVVTGTFSSIFIAGAIVLWWNKGQRPTIGRQLAEQPSAAAPSPA